MDIRNVRVIDAAEEGSNVVSFVLDEDTNLPKYNTAKTALLTEAYPGQNEDINQPAGVKRSIWVCDVIDYNVEETGQKYIIYLGDHNVIDEIALDDDGTFTIDYSHADNYIKNNLIKWITAVSLNEENGHFKIDFNNGDKSYENDLTWVKNLTIGETGLLNTITTTGQNEIKNQQLHWIKDINIDDAKGIITYTDVDGKTATTQQLTWVDDIQFDPNGTITIVDVDGSTRTGPLNAEGDATAAYENLIKWITELSFDAETGRFILKTNNDKINDIDKSLTWIKEFTLSDTGLLNLKTTTGEHDIDNRQLHWVEKIAIDGNTGVATYTDVDKSVTTEQLNWVNKVGFDNDGTVTVEYTDPNKNNDVYENLINWMTSISIAEDGTVTVESNNDTPLLVENQSKLKWPTNIKLAADGKVFTSYNDGTEDSSQNPQLYWITSASVDEIDADNDGNIDDIRLRINYNNSLLNNVDVSLKSVNDIEFKNGGIYAKYSTGGEAVFKGAADEIYLNVIAGAEGEANTDGLRVGGIWFVTEDPMPQAVLLHTANHEAAMDSENTPLKVWEE
jgi:hypothetical protein